MIGKVAAFVLLLGLLVHVHFRVIAMKTPCQKSVPSIADMIDKFGTGATLTPVETRQLYNDVIEWSRSWEKETRAAGDDDHCVAVGCNLLRWRARVYARTRDAETNPYLLAARDVGVHVLSKLSYATIWDALPCLFMHEDYPCPSYPTMRVRKGNDAGIVASCWKANEGYNKMINEKTPGAQANEQAES